LPTNPKPSNLTLFLIFLKIGSFAFGGFMSLIAIVESVIVKDKKWLKQEDIIDGVSLGSILPGPMAVNVITYIGYKINGVKGAIAAFFGVIIPSFIMILVLCDLYLKYNETQLVKSVFQGIMLAVSAIIFQVTWRMSKKTLKNWQGYLLAFIGFLLLILVPKTLQLYATFGIIIVYGLIGYFTSKSTVKQENIEKQSLNLKKIILPFSALMLLLVLSLLPIPFRIGSLEHLFIKFGGLGLMLFGGGYVFIPMIQELVVTQYQWMTQQTFIDAIALGQITPGPIVITIAFVGYKVNGILGAIVATLAIFGAPATLMVLASELLDYFKQSERIQQTMKTIRAGVIGMIFYAGIIVLQSAFQEIDTLEPIFIAKILSLFAICLIALIRFNLNILWVIPLSGFMGYLLF